jgi:cellulose synthase/poly-beta-1,6-N-acetylglucosamine synthase-like glycosyltransferase
MEGRGLSDQENPDCAIGLKNMLSAYLIILIVATSIYSIGLLCFFIGLFFPNKERHDKRYSVSVVIAVRDEEENIGLLLSDLVNQTYPNNLFEVIVVNDHSEDGTVRVVEEFVQKASNIRLIHATETEKRLTPKKNALYQGIKRSRGEIVLTTDGDCRVLPTWVETMVSYFRPDGGMVVGFSQLGHAGGKRAIFQQLQAVDFLSLMAAAQGALNLGWPLAASGQNLAYRRSTFDEVGAFSRIGHRVSGDDVLLLQLIRKRTSWKIRFAASEQAFNVSQPENKLSDLLNQRKRWASNGSYQFILNKPFFLYVLATFLVNLCLLAAVPICCLTSAGVLIPLSCLMVKFIVEGLIIIKGCHVYHRFDLMKIFPLWFVFQIPYVIVVGIIGSLGGFAWKKRNHWNDRRGVG